MIQFENLLNPLTKLKNIETEQNKYIKTKQNKHIIYIIIVNVLFYFFMLCSLSVLKSLALEGYWLRLV